MRLRWYNPTLGDFEWRDMPEADEEALSLLGGPSGAHPCATSVYREWRDLGASVAAALVRAGEAAREAGEGCRRGGEG